MLSPPPAHDARALLLRHVRLTCHVWCSVVPQLSLAGDSGRVSQNAKAARELERLRKAIAQSKATLETVNKDIDEKQAARFVPTRLRSCWIRPHLRCVAVCVCVCAARSSADIDRTLSQTSELRDRATQAAQASTKLAEDRQAAATAAVAELKQLRTDAAAAQEELRRLQAAVSDAEQRTEVARSAADAEEARAHRAAKRLEALTFKVAAANMDHVDKAREAELARSEYSDVVTQHSTAEAGLEAAREQLAALRHQGDEEDRRLRQLLRHVEDQEAALADIVQRAQDATTAAEAAEERHRVGKEAAVQAEQAARDAQLMFDTVNSELELARQRCVPAWGGVCRCSVDPFDACCSQDRGGPEGAGGRSHAARHCVGRAAVGACTQGGAVCRGQRPRVQAANPAPGGCARAAVGGGCCEGVCSGTRATGGACEGAPGGGGRRAVHCRRAHGATHPMLSCRCACLCVCLHAGGAKERRVAERGDGAGAGGGFAS